MIIYDRTPSIHGAEKETYSDKVKNTHCGHDPSVL
jgi:hypothetical protein